MLSDIFAKYSKTSIIRTGRGETRSGYAKNPDMTNLVFFCLNAPKMYQNYQKFTKTYTYKYGNALKCTKKYRNELIID